MFQFESGTSSIGLSSEPVLKNQSQKASSEPVLGTGSELSPIELEF